MQRFARVVQLVCLLIILLWLSACEANQSGAAEGHPIVMGMEPSAVNTFIYIADSQNYFTENGLKVSLKEYSSGMAAVNGMEKNEVELATASEFVIVTKALAGAPIRGLGSIDRFMHNYLFARKDHDIRSVTDLRGKKIGLTHGTSAEFHFGRFLDLRDVQMSQVTEVNLAPEDLVGALTAGSVDAVVAWQPNAKKITDQMGDSVLRWPVQNEQASYCNLISSEAWLTNHPAEARAFLRAIAQAEDFVMQHPGEAKAILQNRLNYNQSYLDAIWPEHEFQLALDQSLVLVMEDEARWMINSHLSSAAQTPVFVTYLYLDGIQAVKPEAVNIIR